jgi:retron-type reverse transcriptase
MTKRLEDILDQTVKINQAYNDLKTQASNDLKNGKTPDTRTVNMLTAMMLESVNLICNELVIQQIDVEG